LANSDSRDDQVLAKQIVEFVKDMPMMQRAAAPQRDVQRAEAARGLNVASRGIQAAVEQARNEPKVER
jgi:hypothetical protein